MPLASQQQTNFGAGIYRGRQAPPAAVYDALNCLIDDESKLYRRGGSAYHLVSLAGVTLTSLADLYLAAGRRLITWGALSSIYALEDGGIAYTAVSTTQPPVTVSRAAQFGALAVMRRANANELIFYGGSLKTAGYSTGTASVAVGAVTVTGSGTSWSANADAGMIFTGAGGFGVVATVDSNTQLTLREPWAGPAVVATSYELAVTAGAAAPASAEALGIAHSAVAAVGSPARLVWCFGNRAYFTDRGSVTFAEDQYHELPASALIVGADAIDDTLLLFTTSGVWAVSNMALDPVDAYGNLQHVVREISKSIILWGDPGIAGFAGSFIVPAADDVYLFSPSEAAVPITGDSDNQRVRNTYRDYLKAGYQPGVATVHRSHYILPILSGVTVIDVLVCRIDRGFAWTRWAGHAASTAYAQRIGSTTRSPQLLSVAGQRVADLTGCFTPSISNAVDADSTTSDCVIITNDYPTGQQPGFVKTARLRYELTDDGSGGTAAPTVALAFTSDQDAGAFTTLTEKGQQGGGAGWGVSDGSKYNWALVGKRRERIRFRVTVTGACASFVLRSVELLMRPSGRQ